MRQAWNRELADARYAAIAWPEEYGGRGAGVMEQVVWAEEMDRAEAPGPINVLGIPNVAPAIMTYGTEEQRKSFLRPMLRGDEIWCQGFSEPDAGSDLASLRTKRGARRRRLDRDRAEDLDDARPSGQLVRAARADRSARHRSTRASRACSSTCRRRGSRSGRSSRSPASTSSTRSSSTRCACRHRRCSDAEHEGWRVAMTTLSHERGGVARLHLGTRAKVQRLFDLARATRDARRSHGGTGSRAASAAGPRLPRGRAAQARVGPRDLRRAARARARPRVEHREARVERDGAAPRARSRPRCSGPTRRAGRWGQDRVGARSHTIAGGTTQVNKNIIAQRVLGLPRST